MLILGLNTATSISQIALISDDKVLVENSWKAERNESEKLLPELQKLLDKTGKKWKDLDKLVVVQGPGPFTALRVSIAVANALAYGLSIPVIGVHVVDYWKTRFDGAFALYAGQNKVYYQGALAEFDDMINSIEPGMEMSGVLSTDQMEKIKEANIQWIDEEKLTSLGSVMSEVLSTNKESTTIKPLYFAKPNITKSTKSYK